MPDVFATVRVGGGGNYTSLAAAEAGLQRNLVSNDQSVHILCEQGTDTSAVTIAGWTTDSTHFIHIYTPGAQVAVWDSNRYTLSVTDADAITIGNHWVTIQRLQIRVTGTGTGMLNIVRSAGAYNCFICDNKMERAGSASTRRRGYGVYAQPLNRVFNNIIWGYDFTSSAFGIYGPTGSEGTIYLMGNLVHSCYVGIYVSGVAGSHYIFNNITYNCTDGFNTPTTGSNDYEDYNISDVAGDVKGSNSKTGTPSFVNASGGDFRLTGSDTLARNSGHPATDAYWGLDHLTTTRSNNNEGYFDIGPFEYHPANLVVQECSLGVSSESPTFTQVHEIAIQACGLESSSDNLIFTQLHILAIDSCDVATSSDSPEPDVSLVAEAHYCLLETSSDRVDAVLEIRQFWPVDGVLATSSDGGFKITQEHTLVVADSTAAVTSEEPEPDFQLVFVGIADGVLATTSEEPEIDKAYIFQVHDSWVFTDNTRVYPFILIQTFSSRKTTALPDFKEVVVLSDDKTSLLMTDSKVTVLAVDLYQ